MLVKSLTQLPSNYHVVILGPRRADRDADLTSLAADKNVADRLHLLEPVEPRQVPAVIADADLFVVPLQNVSLSYKLALPNKLFDAVFARVPIVVSDLPEMKRFVEKPVLGSRAK